MQPWRSCDIWSAKLHSLPSSWFCHVGPHDFEYSPGSLDFLLNLSARGSTCRASSLTQSSADLLLHLSARGSSCRASSLTQSSLQAGQFILNQSGRLLGLYYILLFWPLVKNFASLLIEENKIERITANRSHWKYSSWLMTYLHYSPPPFLLKTRRKPSPIKNQLTTTYSIMVPAATIGPRALQLLYWMATSFR